jgi:hypothetical protein
MHCRATEEIIDGYTITRGGSTSGLHELKEERHEGNTGWTGLYVARDHGRWLVQQLDDT